MQVEQMPIDRLLLEIVRSLVDHPDDVTVTPLSQQNGDTFLEVKVNDRDVGQVMGRRASTLHCIYGVVKAATFRRGRSGGSTWMKLVDPKTGEWVETPTDDVSRLGEW